MWSSHGAPLHRVLYDALEMIRGPLPHNKGNPAAIRFSSQDLARDWQTLRKVFASYGQKYQYHKSPRKALHAPQS